MASACGKVILLGEHAVVYGAPAIAAGIERGASATATPAAEASLTIGEKRTMPGDGTELGRAFEALLSALAAPPMSVEVELTQPAGVGLGASAAIAVAVAGAMLDGSAGDEGDRMARLLDAATAWERVFHGNPSGIDAAAAVYGGCILFTRAEGATPIPVGAPLRLAIGVAGPPASTKEMVEGVAKLRQRRPTIVDKAVDGVTSLVKNAKLCIEAGDIEGLGKLLDLNQMILSGLFVSTEGIERACQIARESGALGAKMTGAGGGGCVIALVRDRPDAVLGAWRDAGIECFATTVAAGGGAP